MRSLIPGLVVLLAASWCGAEDKPEPKKKLDLYHLVKGTKWEYEVKANDMTQEVILEVTKVTPGGKGERDVATITSKAGENGTSEEASADSKGVYRHVVAGTKLETPVTILKYPYKAGDKWTEKRKVGEENLELSFEAHKAEEVKVAAGKYTAYLIAAEVEMKGGKLVAKTWYANGVGIVKQEFDYAGTKVSMELKKFTKAKKDN
jgi:hypothetical protein